MIPGFGISSKIRLSLLSYNYQLERLHYLYIETRGIILSKYSRSFIITFVVPFAKMRFFVTQL